MDDRIEMPDVVVLIPGILGSVLKHNGTTIWGPEWSAIKGVIPVWGKSLDRMTVVDDDPAHDLDDGIEATTTMPDVHLIPGLWKIDGYGRTREEIIRNFQVKQGENFFEFPYDWRRDNRYTAARLQKATHGWLKAWREKSGNDDARLIIVGHSMGGLISRYFIEVLGGWKDTRALITFGTPYRGAAKALGVLINGAEKAFGLVDASAFVRSLTSVYQLLPTYKCFDEGDGKLKYLRSVQLPASVDAMRVRSAWFDFHNPIVQAEKQNRVLDGYPTVDGTRFPIRAVVGYRSPTLSSGFMLGNKLELIADTRLQKGEGDGTVPRISATPEPKFVASAYTTTKHASMQGVDAVLTDLFGFITSLYADVGTYLGESDIRPKATFQVDDAYEAAEPIPIRATLDIPDPAHRLVARIESTANGTAVDHELLTADGASFEAVVPKLDAGFYRITVASHVDIPENRRVEPSTDVFAVSDATALEQALDEA